jgi:UrcA family protein
MSGVCPSQTLIVDASYHCHFTALSKVRLGTHPPWPSARRYMMTRPFTFTALALALVAVAPAHAKWESTERSKSVLTADLNLTSFEGRKLLDRRIIAAARFVCGVGDDRNLRAIAVAGSCYRKAMAEARDQVAAAIRARGQSVAVTASE